MYSHTDETISISMKIYHYTTIQNLALILKHKTIRFNRLDFVDDAEESIYLTGNGPEKINLCQYVFVSCWTKASTENLSLWNMYTNYKGVRIGLDSELLFNRYPINDHIDNFFQGLFHIEGDVIFDFVNNPYKLIDVIYVGNVKEHIKHIGSFSNGAFNFNPKELGVYKNKAWSCQEESRFILRGQPLDIKKLIPALAANIDRAKKQNINLSYLFAMSFVDNLRTAFFANHPCNTKYVDLPIKDRALDQIEILLGPKTTEADRIIVEAITDGLTNKKITESYFKGKIRK